MKSEFSAGGIVLRQAQDKLLGNQVLLIHNYSSKTKRDFWGFPKGHINAGELVKDAALREVFEETGIKAEIVEKLGENKYYMTWDGQRILKRVVIFLMKYVAGEVTPQEGEVIEAGWYSIGEAQGKVTFDHDRELLKKLALRF